MIENRGISGIPFAYESPFGAVAGLLVLKQGQNPAHLPQPAPFTVATVACVRVVPIAFLSLLNSKPRFPHCGVELNVPSRARKPHLPQRLIGRTLTAPGQAMAQNRERWTGVPGLRARGVRDIGSIPYEFVASETEVARG